MSMPTFPDIDAYLAAQPEPARSTLQTMRAMIHEIVPDATEAISYGCPAFKLRGKAFAGFAAFAKHCSYFPHSGRVLPALADRLEGFTYTPGSLHFPHDEPLSRELLSALINERTAAIP